MKRPNSQTLRFLLHVVGSGLGLAGIVFVGIRLFEHAEQVDFSSFGLIAWGALASFALTYGAAYTMFARAWWCQLAFFGLHTDWLWALRTYGLSQLAKYVPGNIFHLAGRQAIGMAAGLPAGPLAKSVAWELGSSAVAGACFSLLILPLIWSPVGVTVAVLMFVCLLALLCLATARFLSTAAAFGLLWQAAFLALSGTIFIGILALVSDFNLILPLAPAICGAYVVAWLVGLVVPGAPAGVGVREMVLLYLLKEQISPEALVLAVILGRIVTVMGDLLFFGAMNAIRQGRVALKPSERN